MLKICDARYNFTLFSELNAILLMRIDQYLWCVRYFKSRNVASNACKKGQVKINGQVVKPSREVLRQDKLDIRKIKLYINAWF